MPNLYLINYFQILFSNIIILKKFKIFTLKKNQPGKLRKKCQNRKKKRKLEFDFSFKREFWKKLLPNKIYKTIGIFWDYFTPLFQ